jgi:hypothetical protein
MRRGSGSKIPLPMSPSLTLHREQSPQFSSALLGSVQCRVDVPFLTLCFLSVHPPGKLSLREAVEETVFKKLPGTAV